MLRKILFPLLLGLAGCGVLIALGVWQVERLAWKQDILAGINLRLADLEAHGLDIREISKQLRGSNFDLSIGCLLYTSDAADEYQRV